MELQQIYNLVMRSLNLDSLKTNKRTRDYVDGRFIYCKLCKLFTFESNTDIGKSINRSHCLITHALSQFKSLMLDKSFKDSFIKCVDNLDENSKSFIKLNNPDLYSVYVKGVYVDKINAKINKMNGYDLEYFYKTTFK